MLHKPVVWLGETPFWVHPAVQRTHSVPSIDNLRQVTYVRTDKGSIDDNALRKWRAEFESKDDVFNQEFLKTIVIESTTGQDIRLEEGAHKLLQTWSSEVIISNGADVKSLRPGPYFFSKDSAHQAWKFYEDSNRAFVLSLKQDEDEPTRYKPLEVSGVFGAALAIAVPSRLYFSPTPEKPLDGVRIAVKDIYDIKGTHTAASNRAYREHFGIRNKTAPSIQRLIDLGCIIIGKTKTSAFADLENPPCDWIEELAPFNPRGDGYLITGGSSAGSGAAIAAYPWLDVGIGSDTCGSIRSPAANNAVFGLRPTYGAITMENVTPFCKYYDTAGFFTRDINEMASFATKWYQFEQKKHKKPSKLLHIPQWDTMVEDIPVLADLYETFLAKLEAYLGVKRQPVNIEERWKVSDPSKLGLSFEEYFRCTYEHVQWPASYQNHLEWGSPYAQQRGKTPWLPPCIKNRSPYMREITNEQFLEGLTRSKKYEEWWDEDIMKTPKGEAPPVLVYRYSPGVPVHRDIRQDPPNTGRNYGFSKIFSSVFAGTPELTVPIGQYRYYSRVSQRKEWLPISVSIIFPKGYDSMLLEFIRDFLSDESVGLHSEVMTGTTAFPAEEYKSFDIDWDFC